MKCTGNTWQNLYHRCLKFKHNKAKVKIIKGKNNEMATESGGELGARGKREGLISYVGLVKN